MKRKLFASVCGLALAGFAVGANAQPNLSIATGPSNQDAYITLVDAGPAQRTTRAHSAPSRNVAIVQSTPVDRTLGFATYHALPPAYYYNRYGFAPVPYGFNEPLVGSSSFAFTPYFGSRYYRPATHYNGYGYGAPCWAPAPYTACGLGFHSVPDLNRYRLYPDVN